VWNVNYSHGKHHNRNVQVQTKDKSEDAVRKHRAFANKRGMKIHGIEYRGVSQAPKEVKEAEETLSQRIARQRAKKARREAHGKATVDKVVGHLLRGQSFDVVAWGLKPGARHAANKIAGKKMRESDETLSQRIARQKAQRLVGRGTNERKKDK